MVLKKQHFIVFTKLQALFEATYEITKKHTLPALYKIIL